MTGMCPHCGEIVALKEGLTKYHDWPRPTRQVCPGSRQIPRNPESDGRPLWNGKSNPHFYKNRLAEEALADYGQRVIENRPYEDATTVDQMLRDIRDNNDETV